MVHRSHPVKRPGSSVAKTASVALSPAPSPVFPTQHPQKYPTTRTYVSLCWSPGLSHFQNTGENGVTRCTLEPRITQALTNRNKPGDRAEAPLIAAYNIMRLTPSTKRTRTRYALPDPT